MNWPSRIERPSKAVCARRVPSQGFATLQDLYKAREMLLGRCTVRGGHDLGNLSFLKQITRPSPILIDDDAYVCPSYEHFYEGEAVVCSKLD